MKRKAKPATDAQRRRLMELGLDPAGVTLEDARRLIAEHTDQAAARRRRSKAGVRARRRRVDR